MRCQSEGKVIHELSQLSALRFSYQLPPKRRQAGISAVIKCVCVVAVVMCAGDKKAQGRGRKKCFSSFLIAME
jgi:hypothetical protein